jgi:hypothetical protein
MRHQYLNAVFAAVSSYSKFGDGEILRATPL